MPWLLLNTMHASFNDCSGNCLNELTKYCPSVDPGEGKLADCMSDQIAESEVVTDGKSNVMS